MASVLFAIGLATAIVITLWQGLCALKQGFQHLRRLHQIPCSRCAYFTGDYRLKCTVDPFSALTEAAIDCPDYQPSEPKVMVCAGCSRDRYGKRYLDASKALLKR